MTDHRDELSRRIALAQEDGSEALDLSGLNLTEIPATLGGLKGLKTLDLSFNSLSRLPEEIGDLTALVRLNLDDNQLTALPAEIGRLGALERLDADGNQLTALPAAIGRLKALTTLSVQRNRLRALPEEIGDLTALTELDLSSNGLSTLPREIGNLTSLTTLSVDSNRLSELPGTIGGLGALTRLDLPFNSLSRLPEEIGDLTALTHLNLDENELTALPAAIGRLGALERLDADGNEFSALPAEIGRLKALTTLYLQRNQLAALPEEIGGLTALTELYLSDNRLRTLPEAMGDLTNLTELILSNNQFSTLPEAVGNLTGLIELILSNNQLRTLPEAIGRLTSLTTLFARHNELSELPEALGELRNLTTLNVSGNQLGVLPETIGGLTSLDALDLSNNRFSALPDALDGLTALTRLNLSDNRFTALPEWASDLTDLVELDLSLNRLRALPKGIGDLTTLIDLDLSGNLFSALPAEIGGLTALVRLNLDDNRLTALPAEIGRLGALERLDADGNQLSALPAEIGRLTALTTLYLQRNAFTVLPEEVTSLTALATLVLSDNRLTELPEKLGRLAALERLHVDGNELSALPGAIGRLTSLASLQSQGNRLRALPAEIGGLSALVTLNLSGNQLTALPAAIGRLTFLTQLDLSDNQLTALPAAIGRLIFLTHLGLSDNRLEEVPGVIAALGDLIQLILDENAISVIPDFVLEMERLSILSVRGNRIISPPPAIVAAGTESILTFLRARREGASEQWVSKLLIVGEGGVGKTSLLKALAGEPHDRHEPSTHGLRIGRLNISHPRRADVDMRLSVWDFGGQEIYHATHQFFLTDRSLFLLAWNSRLGWEQGKLQYWLDIITARAPESPILLIATHADQDGRPVDLPLDELRAEYPQIVSGVSVDSEARNGIEALRNELREQAAKLPLMGSEWPTSWQAAAERLRAMEEKHITPERMWEVMAQAGVEDPTQQQYVAVTLHQLGDILYYHDDDNLSQSVILRPEWVNAYISKVLDSPEVDARDGVLTRRHLSVLWSDLDRGLRHHFLDMMDKYDLSYQIEGSDGTDLSLVVERLGWNPPQYQQLWDGAARGRSHEIRVLYELNSMPPGIPTWFIARSHRFTTHLHWRTGALLRHPDGRHFALVRADRHRHLVELAVRGPAPAAFFSLLDDGLNRTLERFPGLSIKRLVPCPCAAGADTPCAEKFDYEDLQRRLLLNPPRHHIECRKSLELLDVPSLLFGLAPPERNVSRADIERITDLVMAQGEKIDGQTEFMQRMFVKTQRIAQAYREILCPSVFTLVELKRKALTGATYELRLYCEEPGAWHRLPDNEGCYQIQEPPEWLVTIAPYLKHLLNVLKHAAPMAGPILGMSVDHLSQQTKAEADAMKELIAQIPELTAERREREASETGGGAPEAHATSEADFRALEALLVKYDPKRAWGGLSRTTTPEGLTLYLCAQHSLAYRGSVKVDLAERQITGENP